MVFYDQSVCAELSSCFFEFYIKFEFWVYNSKQNVKAGIFPYLFCIFVWQGLATRGSAKHRLSMALKLVLSAGDTMADADTMLKFFARAWYQNVVAGVILTHPVGVNLTHLGNDGGFLATDNVDSGASSGDQGNGASRRQHSGDGQAARLLTQHGQAIHA